MDNVKKLDSYISIISSQTYRPYLPDRSRQAFMWRLQANSKQCHLPNDTVSDPIFTYVRAWTLPCRSRSSLSLSKECRLKMILPAESVLTQYIIRVIKRRTNEMVKTWWHTSRRITVLVEKPERKDFLHLLGITGRILVTLNIKPETNCTW
jgi:hypothetical protein